MLATLPLTLCACQAPVSVVSSPSKRARAQSQQLVPASPKSPRSVGRLTMPTEETPKPPQHFMIFCKKEHPGFAMRFPLSAAAPGGFVQKGVFFTDSGKTVSREEAHDLLQSGAVLFSIEQEAKALPISPQKALEMNPMYKQLRREHINMEANPQRYAKAVADREEKKQAERREAEMKAKLEADWKEAQRQEEVREEEARLRAQRDAFERLVEEKEKAKREAQEAERQAKIAAEQEAADRREAEQRAEREAAAAQAARDLLVVKELAVELAMEAVLKGIASAVAAAESAERKAAEEEAAQRAAAEREAIEKTTQLELRLLDMCATNKATQSQLAGAERKIRSLQAHLLDAEQREQKADNGTQQITAHVNSLALQLSAQIREAKEGIVGVVVPQETAAHLMIQHSQGAFPRRFIVSPAPILLRKERAVKSVTFMLGVIAFHAGF